MLLALLIAAGSVQIWAWRSLIRRVRSGTLSRVQGVVRFAGWAFLPVAMFVGGFLALVGLEELLAAALIGERAALLVLPVFALATVGSIGFALRCALVRQARVRSS